MAKHYWSCRKCGHRNDRNFKKCHGTNCAEARPKKRVVRHAVTLRDDSYKVYQQASRDIHGVSDESCCVCGRPRSQERRHDRDHDHITGKPRGLACGGNSGCNPMMLKWMTSAVVRAIAAQTVDPVLRQRWVLIADYLERVEDYYALEVAS